MKFLSVTDLILYLIRNAITRDVNQPAYKNALRQHSSLTVWLDESTVDAWTDSAQPEGRGRPLHYTDIHSDDEARV